MGYHLHGLQAKQKAGTNNHASLRKSLAPALKALALVDIYVLLPLAVPAPGNHSGRFRVLRDLHHMLVHAATGANQVSVFHCQHSTTSDRALQEFHPLSFDVCRLFNYIPR
jgi:hypothetical protein